MFPRGKSVCEHFGLTRNNTAMSLKRMAVGATTAAVLLATIGIMWSGCFSDVGGHRFDAHDGGGGRSHGGIDNARLPLLWANYLDNVTNRFPSEQCSDHISFLKTTPHTLPTFKATPTIPIYAETKLNTCNLLLDGGCEKIATGAEDSPDVWIQEVLARSLAGCADGEKHCLALDFGSNLGLLTLRMLQHGAHVVAVEPQPDLNCAAQASAQLAGFRDRSKFLIGGVSHSAGEPKEISFGDKGLYRYGNQGTEFYMKAFFEEAGITLPLTVPLHYIPDLVSTQKGMNAYSFVKVDTDTIDCEILRLLLDMQRQAMLSFETLTLETWTGPTCDSNELFSQLLADLQQDGYSVYRARNDKKDDMPSLTDKGHALNPKVTMWKMPRHTAEQWKGKDKGFRMMYQMLVTRDSSFK